MLESVRLAFKAATAGTRGLLYGAGMLGAMWMVLMGVGGVIVMMGVGSGCTLS